MTVASILWRRLDTPGHDACRLERTDAGWVLDGTAVFRHDDAPAWLTYRIACDLAWHTQNGEVHGWLGPRAVDYTILRTDDACTLNGDVAPGLESCTDLDLAFTPATNLIQLRRVALTEGQAADVPAAWLDTSAGALKCLPQRYERRGNSAYWYQAPSVSYVALLETDPAGFIRRYPGLWETEP